MSLKILFPDEIEELAAAQQQTGDDQAHKSLNRFDVVLAHRLLSSLLHAFAACLPGS